MKTQVYESAVLINAALEDDQIDNIINRIKETVTANGGEINDVEDWGRKRLAYTVKKSKIGYYVILRYNSPPDLISKLERLFQLDANILRNLTIKLSKDALEQIEKNKAQDAALLAEEIVPSEPAVEETESGEENNEESNKESENI